MLREEDESPLLGKNMPELHSLILFILTALVLLVTPGPAVLFVVTRTLQQGRTAGLISVLGLCCGGLIHVLAAVFGLSALLASSAAAFTIVKFSGAAYLLFLGFKTLLSSGDSTGKLEVPSRSFLRLFIDGFIVNVLNPKTAIFFLAFLPQFVSPAEQDTVRTQLAILGFIFIFLALITDGLYAMMAGSFRALLARQPRVVRYQRYFSAAVYFGLSISTTLSGRKSN